MELKDLAIEEIATVTAGAAIGVPAFWLFLKRTFMNTKAVEANSEIIMLLRDEVQRVHAENITLSTQLQAVMQERRLLDKRVSDLEHELEMLCNRMEQAGINPNLIRNQQ